MKSSTLVDRYIVEFEQQNLNTTLGDGNSIMSFRSYLQEDNEFERTPLQSRMCVDKCRREDPPTEEMRRGSKYHAQQALLFARAVLSPTCSLQKNQQAQQCNTEVPVKRNNTRSTLAEILADFEAGSIRSSMFVVEPHVNFARSPAARGDTGSPASRTNSSQKKTEQK